MPPTVPAGVVAPALWPYQTVDLPGEGDGGVAVPDTPLLLMAM
jgi:hypothetical protein